MPHDLNDNKTKKRIIFCSNLLDIYKFSNFFNQIKSESHVTANTPIINAFYLVTTGT